MNDDLSALKSLMDQATPAPDIDRRAANTALAQRRFEALHRGSLRRHIRWRDWPAERLTPVTLSATAVVAFGVVFLAPLPSSEPTLQEQPVAALEETIVERSAGISTTISEADDTLGRPAEGGIATRTIMQSAPVSTALGDAVESELVDTHAGTGVAALLSESGLFALAGGVGFAEGALTAPLPWDPTRHVLIVSLGARDTIAIVESTGEDGESITTIVGQTSLVTDEAAFSPASAILRDAAGQRVTSLTFDGGQAEAGYAVAVYGFGLLQEGALTAVEWTYSDAVALAEANRGPDPTGQRAAMIERMRAAAP